MRIVQIPGTLREEILAAARAAFPLECCGLIEGEETPRGWRAYAVHTTRNLAQDPSCSFEIDPKAHIALLRALRGGDRRIIGCFHSHPNGRSTPSVKDREMAIEPGFLWLIAHGAEREMELSAFVYGEESGEFSALSLEF